MYSQPVFLQSAFRLIYIQTVPALIVIDAITMQISHVSIQCRFGFDFRVANVTLENTITWSRFFYVQRDGAWSNRKTCRTSRHNLDSRTQRALFDVVSIDLEIGSFYHTCRI